MYLYASVLILVCVRQVCVCVCVRQVCVCVYVCLCLSERDERERERAVCKHIRTLRVSVSGLVMRAALCVALAASASAWVSPALTPPMGWNSWNYWHCAVNGTILMETAQAMVRVGPALSPCILSPVSPAPHV